MKDIIAKYWKIGLIGIGLIAASILIYVVGTYIYRNSYSNERYEYSTKQYLNQVLDENVVIDKKIKRNNKDGRINMTFDRKNLEEIHKFTLGSEIEPSTVEISVTGKLESGSMHIALEDENNEVIFDRIVKGTTIKEISTPATTSKYYKLIVLSSEAKRGDISISFKFK